MRTRLGLLAVTALMVVGFAFGGVFGAPAAMTAGADHAAPATAAPSVVSTGASSPVVAAPAENLGAEMASSALAATKAAGISPQVVFVPRPSASPAQIASAKATGVITPLYNGNPAPMGLSDLGLSAGPGDTVIGTVQNTTSVRGSVDMNSTGIEPMNLVDSSPDGYGIQLNAVTTNITLFGVDNYTFWTQDVLGFFPQTHFMYLDSNVWNFSGGPLSTNVFYSHAPGGVQVGTEYYYHEAVIPFPVYYPFNLTFWMNNTITNGRNNVSFTIQLNSSTYPSENFTYPYDWVVFNSTALGGTPLTVPSNYTINGQQYSPIGLPEDLELTLGGPGGGSQATLFDADATMGLATWNATSTSYQSVPSAFDFGSETGETVTGASIAWSNAPGGPAGLPTYATLTTGPSVLTGLWNASAPEGSYPVTLSVTPANAFNIVNTTGASVNFTDNEPAVAPEAFTNTLYLTPGVYTVLSELSDFTSATTVINVTGPTTVVVALSPDPAAGIYTPLWAFNNSDVATLAVSGLGTAIAPYIMPNTQSAPIGPDFGVYNDYAFPAYPAVFLYGTNVTTEFVNPPSFSTTTNTFQFPGSYLPAHNDLQYWFWNDSNVGLLNATAISGWFGEDVFYPAVFDTFNVIFYEGSNNLIAGNTFVSGGSQGLLIFSGSNFFAPPLNVGGDNYTVWGNTFETTFLAPTTACLHAPTAGIEALCTPLPFYLGLGLELAGPNNTIYNNAFLTPTTAWLIIENLYSGTIEFFPNTFNITPEAASVVNYAPGFPGEPLTGSILGTSTQGGNYWWDYGIVVNPYNGADNPYGMLPYDENGTTYLGYGPWIYPGGDYAPLTTGLFGVTVTESGLPSGTSWDIQVFNSDGFEVANNTTSATSIDLVLTNGTYTYTLSSGNASYAAARGGFSVVGAPTSVSVEYALVTYAITFTESGLPSSQLARHGWSVEVDGELLSTDSATSLVFHLSNGTYNYLVLGPSGYDVASGVFADRCTTNAGLTVIVCGSAAVVDVAFSHGRTAVLTFTEKGLPLTQNWCVEVEGLSLCSDGRSVKFPALTPGEYSYSVVSPLTGQTITGKIARSTVNLTGGVTEDLDLASSTTVALTFAYPYTVTFTEIGLSTGTWSVTIHGVTETSAAGDPIVFHLTNDTYSYRIGAEAGYTSHGTPPRLTVDGAATSVAVSFNPRR